MKKGLISTLSAAIGVGVGTVAGAVVAGEKLNKEINKQRQTADKYLELFLMMNQWVKVKQEGKSLKEYFLNNDLKTIAIYGMSYAGETLVDELKGSGITVLYGIDMRADSIYSDIEIVSPEDNLKEVDAVIVTPVYFFDEIEEMLGKKMECPIVSLEDILYEV